MAWTKEGPDIEQDLAFERRQWVVERAGWGLMAAIVAAGLLGAFGHGPLSWAVVREGRLAVAHDRFGRFAGETQLRVTVGPIPGERVEVSIGREFLEAMEVSAVTPEPSDIRFAGDSLVYAFPAAEGV